jgi:hypothetical protein
MCIIFSLIVKLLMHLNPPITWSSKFWYPSLIGSFMISQQVYWYPNAAMTITWWANHLYSASVNFGSQLSYIIIDNLMNESLSFRTIFTKVTFVTISLASLMLDSTCFVRIASWYFHSCSCTCQVPPWSLCCTTLMFWNFLPKLDTPICQTGQFGLTDLLRSFFFWTDSYIVAFFFATKAPSLR